MSIDRFKWERAVRDAEMAPTRKLVLLLLGTYLDADGGGARPSLSTLGVKAGLGVSTVRRHVTESINAGWLLRERRGHRLWTGVSMSSSYRAGLPQPLASEHMSDTETPDTTARQRAHEDLHNCSLDDTQPLASEHLPSPLDHEKLQQQPAGDYEPSDDAIDQEANRLASEKKATGYPVRDLKAFAGSETVRREARDNLVREREGRDAQRAAALDTAAQHGARLAGLPGKPDDVLEDDLLHHWGHDLELLAAARAGARAIRKAAA